MSKARLLLATAVILSAAAAIQSQVSTQYDRGTPPQHAVGVSSFGSYVSADLGTINLTNGALNFKIPLGSIGGRGGLSMPVSLNYSSKLWSASMDTDIESESGTEQPVAYADFDRGLSVGGSFAGMIGAGWTISGWPSLDAKRVPIGKIPSGPNAGCYNYLLAKLTLYLPDRGEIELRDDAYDGAPLSTNCAGTTASRGTRWHATDGSGIIFINDVDNGVAQWPAPDLSGVVITADGTRIRFGPSGEMKDRNGNKITGLTDQLGRTTTWQYNVPDPDNPSVTVAVLVTIPGYQGQNRYYKIKTGIMNQNYRSGINPALPVITGDWDPEGWGYNWWGSPTRLFLKSYGLYAQRIDDREVLTELVLPDGRSLKFKYNQFGEVAEVELPTGGRIQYDYAYRASLPTGNSPNWETGTNGAGSGIVTDVKFVDRAITAKRTYPDGVTLEGTWTYGFTSSTSTEMVTSASGSLLSHTRHYFLASGRYTDYFNWPYGHDGTFYNLWSTGLEYRTESLDSSGVVIAATEQDWTQRAAVAWSSYQQEQPANDNRVNQARRYLETGAMSKVETFYDLFNNPTEVKEYDFDQSLKRRTLTTYSSTNLVNGVNYAADSIWLISLPLQQSIYDGAGVEQARTTYEYDIYAADGNHDSMLSYPSITGHDTANYGTNRTTRGNVTRIGNWIKTTDSYVYTYPRYDIAGNVVSMKDARGNVATLSFTDDFGNGANPGGGVQGTYGPTYAFPTLITSPPPTPGAPVHTARSQYDFSTGLLSGFKDRNGIVTQTLYSDPFNRPTQVNAAFNTTAEARTRMYYANQTTEFGIVLAKNDVLTASDQNSLDDKALRSWTKTDGFGRITEAWSKDPQGDVKVVTVFDALGRSKQVSNPYRPSLGETPVYTTSAYDLAGRVTSVTTPDNAVVSTSYSGNTVTVTDQANKQRKSVTDALGRLTSVYEDPAGVNYLTSYSYDTLDNLITVSQGSQTRTFVYDSLKRLTSATNPESGTISYQYDNNGNLTSKTDARSITATFIYDALNRVTSRSYSDGTPAVTYGYDTAINGKGRFASVSSSVSATNYLAYDALGRMTSGNQITDGQTYPMSYAYNRAGGQTSMTYPSGRVITSEYDGGGRLAGVRDQSSGVYYAGAASTDATNRMQYTAHGAVSVMKLGNGLWEHTNFNSRLQPTEIGLGTSSTSTGTMGLTYSYGTTNNNGNVQSLSYSGGGLSYTQSFGYDQLNRLTTSNENSGSSWSETNGYDRYGNRWIDLGGGNQSLYFNSSNNRITNSGYVYDSAGNLTNDTLHTYGFDAENKIKTVDGVNDVYRYDGGGNRVRKNFSSGEKVRMVYSGGQLIAEYDLSNGALLKEYVYGAKGLVATIEPSNGTRYTTADHLGSPRVVTNSSAGVVSRHDYMPFGVELGAGVGGRTIGMGFSVADGVRQKFTGYERDSESGLDYAHARYYASAQGRFTSIDPLLASGRQGLPQSWNRYGYVLNNPLRLIDPTGLADENPSDQEKKKPEQPPPPQVVDVRKDPNIVDAVETIKANGTPLAEGETPKLSSVVTVVGQTTQLNNTTVIDAYGQESLPMTGTLRPVGFIPLDQGGNIMPYTSGVINEEFVVTEVGSEPETSGVAPLPPGRVFIDLHTIGPKDPVTKVNQSVVITQRGEGFKIGPNKITKDPAARQISVEKGPSKPYKY